MNSSALTIDKQSRLCSVLAIVTIVLANWLAYSNCFNGYFLADDFVHVDYLYHAISKQFQPLLANFWGNWMQAQGTTFYRPLISVTLAIDYLAGGANPFVFHLTNWLYQTAASCLTFLLVRRIGAAFRPGQVQLNQNLALAAGLIFSLYPLHSEVVNWIIARVDSVALTFCLASFWLYLKSDKWSSWQAKLSLVAFIFGLMSKEMAVTLPPTLLLFHLLTQEPLKPLERLKLAIKQTLPFWIILFCYFVFRLIVLGTISGGYEGSVGQSLSQSLGRRWLDGSLWRILYPFNIEVFGARHSFNGQLKIIYMAMLVNFSVLLFTLKARSAALRGLAFGLGWLALSLLPTYQVWNLTDSLQGGRLIYYGTAPIALIFAWLIFPGEGAALARPINGLRMILAAWFCTILLLITQGNNQPWTYAMQEVSRFRQAVAERVLQMPPDQSLCLLNVPQTYRGAHMLYNAATMSVLLSPPLTKEAIYKRVKSFEPATFGDSDLINISRVRLLSADANNMFVRWDRQNMQLSPVALHSGETPGNLQATKLLAVPPTMGLVDSTRVLLSPILKITAIDWDYIDIKCSGIKSAGINSDELKSVDKKNNSTAQLVLEASTHFGNKAALSLPLTKIKDGLLRFHVSEHKKWLALGDVSQITLSLQALDPGESLTISGMAFGSLSGHRPILKCDGITLVEDVDGICNPKGQAERAAFSYDASSVAGAATVYYEVSKPNSWFEHYTGSLRDNRPSKEAQFSGTLTKLKGSAIPITFTGLKGHGFFQLRLAALDEEGKLIGYFSDPLNFHI